MLLGGILGGALATTGALMAGAGPLLALAAYSLGGMATIILIIASMALRPPDDMDQPDQ